MHVRGVPRIVLENVSCSRTGTWPVEPLRGGCRKQLADTQPPLQPHFPVQYNRGLLPCCCTWITFWKNSHLHASRCWRHIGQAQRPHWVGVDHPMAIVFPLLHTNHPIELENTKKSPTASPNKAPITPNPQGVTTLQPEESTLFDVWGVLTCWQTSFHYKTGGLVFLNLHSKTSSVMPLDADDPLVTVKPKSTSAHHHRSIRPSQDWGFCLFLPRRQDLHASRCWWPIDQAHRHQCIPSWTHSS